MVTVVAGGECLAAAVPVLDTNPLPKAYNLTVTFGVSATGSEPSDPQLSADSGWGFPLRISVDARDWLTFSALAIFSDDTAFGGGAKLTLLNDVEHWLGWGINILVLFRDGYEELHGQSILSWNIRKRSTWVPYLAVVPGYLRSPNRPLLSVNGGLRIGRFRDYLGVKLDIIAEGGYETLTFKTWNMSTGIAVLW
ncbi:MAG: hypothetical protein HY897_21160 [Deltaproteobacteria bacterium]|nr:hypothetical protein [Deltaproteobacteria bacterium]